MYITKKALASAIAYESVLKYLKIYSKNEIITDIKNYNFNNNYKDYNRKNLTKKYFNKDQSLNRNKYENELIKSPYKKGKINCFKFYNNNKITSFKNDIKKEENILKEQINSEKKENLTKFNKLLLKKKDEEKIKLQESQKENKDVRKSKMLNEVKKLNNNQKLENLKEKINKNEENNNILQNDIAKENQNSITNTNLPHKKWKGKEKMIDDDDDLENEILSEKRKQRIKTIIFDINRYNATRSSSYSQKENVVSSSSNYYANYYNNLRNRACYSTTNDILKAKHMIYDENCSNNSLSNKSLISEMNNKNTKDNSEKNKLSSVQLKINNVTQENDILQETNKTQKEVKVQEINKSKEIKKNLNANNNNIELHSITKKKQINPEDDHKKSNEVINTLINKNNNKYNTNSREKEAPKNMIESIFEFEKESVIPKEVISKSETEFSFIFERNVTKMTSDSKEILYSIINEEVTNYLKTHYYNLIDTTIGHNFIKNTNKMENINNENNKKSHHTKKIINKRIIKKYYDIIPSSIDNSSDQENELSEKFDTYIKIDKYYDKNNHSYDTNSESIIESSSLSSLSSTSASTIQSSSPFYLEENENFCNKERKYLPKLRFNRKKDNIYDAITSDTSGTHTIKTHEINNHNHCENKSILSDKFIIKYEKNKPFSYSNFNDQSEKNAKKIEKKDYDDNKYHSSLSTFCNNSSLNSENSENSNENNKISIQNPENTDKKEYERIKAYIKKASTIKAISLLKFIDKKNK